MRFSHRSAAQSALASVFILAASLSASAQSARAPARVTQAVDPEKLVTLPGDVHPLARPRYDQGLAPDSLSMPRMLLVLRRSADQESALQQLLVNQQVKSRPNFHQWLTPQQFGQQFGPADADIQAVTDWLTSQGFQVNRISNGRTVIEFSGTAGLVRQAFHTEIHQYVVNGQAHWANASNPQIPAALAPVVAGINSLNSFPRKPQSLRLGTFERTKATGEVKPLFTFTCPSGATACGSGTFYGVGPSDFATIYNVLPLWNQGTNGTGQTIAIVAQSNINCQDLASFRQLFGLSYTATSATNPCPNSFNVVLDGPDPGIVGPTTATDDEGEAILDAEWTSAVAPGATIDLVVSETPAENTSFFQGVDLSAVYIVDNNLAPILSDSYGACEYFLGATGNLFYSSLWEQAAAQGITVVVATGDTGSAGCDGPPEIAAGYDPTDFGDAGLAVGGFASTPYNVAVGGTDFNNGNVPSPYWNTTNNSTTQASAMSYIPETTWDNSSCAHNLDYGVSNATVCNPNQDGSDLTGGSGGESNCVDAACSEGYAKPSWQTGNGVPTDGLRDIPDISLFASNGYNGSFYIVCEADSNPGSNTTSCDLNSPYEDFQGVGGTSASAQAFAGVMALVLQAQNGQRQGNANFVLYPLAKYAANNSAYCPSGSSSVTNTSCIFYDVNNSSNNSVACAPGSSNCSTGPLSSEYGILVSPYLTTLTAAWLAGTGYDMATGLGTVDVFNLVNNWSKGQNFQPTSTSLTLSPTSLTHGQNVSVTVNVIPQNGIGGGSVSGDVSLIGCTVQTVPCPQTSLLSRGAGIDFNTLTSGTVTWSTDLLPGGPPPNGTYYISAHYAGDGTHGSSDSTPPTKVTVGKESSLTQATLVGVTNNTATYGSYYVLRLDVTNASGTLCSTTGAPSSYTITQIPCPTGQVKVTDNTQPLPASDDVSAPPSNTPGTYNLNSEGFTEDQYIQFPAGAHSVVASYQGDNSYNTSASTPAYPFTVSQATTSTNLADTAQGASSFTLTATVSTNSFGLAPAGTNPQAGACLSACVQFFNGGTPITGSVNYAGTAGNAVNGTYASLTATLTTTFSAAATVTAQYMADTNYGASPVSNSVQISGTADFTFNPPSPTSSTIAAGSPAMFTISAGSSFGFSSAIGLTCAVAPVVQLGPTCSLNPASVNPGTNSTLTVSTTAPSLVPPKFVGRRPPAPPTPVLVALALLLAAWICYLWTRRQRALVGVTLAAVVLLLVLGLASCNGGSSSGGGGSPGTPSGAYTVTVTGTSGTLSHNAQVTVNVQ
ncbi:MAG: protease pro-enzyme activation domain-containing protein [Terriglobia bacterium]